MNYCCTVSLFVFTLLSIPLAAQGPVFAGASAHYGFIIPHSRELIDVSRTRPAGVEGIFGWHISSAESGITSRRGFKVSFIHFNNAQVLGYSINAASFAEPLLASHHRFFASFPLEFGLTYNNKVYNASSNPTNLFFSLPVNFFLSAGLRCNWRIRPDLLLTLSAHYQHISNGGVKQPNKGMNFPTAALGLFYYMQEPSWEKPSGDRVAHLPPRFTANALLFGSVKTIDLPEEKTMLGGYQLSLVRRIGLIHGLVAGLEGIWNGYKKEYYRRKGQHVNAFEQSLQLGYEMRLGKTSFQVLAGCDVYNDNRTTDLIYQRYGLYYRLLPHLKIGGTIKAHRHVADVIDLRVGYTIGRQ